MLAIGCRSLNPKRQLSVEVFNIFCYMIAYNILIATLHVCLYSCQCIGRGINEVHGEFGQIRSPR